MGPHGGEVGEKTQKPASIGPQMALWDGKRLCGYTVAHTVTQALSVQQAAVSPCECIVGYSEPCIHWVYEPPHRPQKSCMS